MHHQDNACNGRHQQNTQHLYRNIWHPQMKRHVIQTLVSQSVPRNSITETTIQLNDIHTRISSNYPFDVINNEALIIAVSLQREAGKLYAYQ